MLIIFSSLNTSLSLSKTCYIAKVKKKWIANLSAINQIPGHPCSENEEWICCHSAPLADTTHVGLNWYMQNIGKHLEQITDKSLLYVSGSKFKYISCMGNLSFFKD